jgi:hypothetical protein
VADTLVKPVEAVPSTAAVGDGPAQQTTQLVQRGVVRPLSPRPTPRIHTAKAFLPEQPGIETELAEVRKAWRVYGFSGCHAMAALQLRDEEFSGGPSPSARCTADEARTIRNCKTISCRTHEAPSGERHGTSFRPTCFGARPRVTRMGSGSASRIDDPNALRWRIGYY